jgi:hypothetical protein
VKNHLSNAIKFIQAFLGNSTFISMIVLWFFEK